MPQRRRARSSARHVRPQLEVGARSGIFFDAPIVKRAPYGHRYHIETVLMPSHRIRVRPRRATPRRPVVMDPEVLVSFVRRGPYQADAGGVAMPHPKRMEVAAIVRNAARLARVAQCRSPRRHALRRAS